MKLCVFQGTFNPIHNGHLYMADYALKNFGFEKIIFIPAYIPPHKEAEKTSAFHRLNMTKLAIKNYPDFEVSDIEFQRQQKSYSYLTALELYKNYDIEGKINFIIGTDAFEKLESWYEIDKFKQIVKFIVFVREDDFLEQKYNEFRKKNYNFEFAKMNYNDISSTDIRNRIKEGKSVSDILPNAVERYIKENELYKN